MKLQRQAYSIILAILILLISIPMLASCPQGGDGAEMVNTALYGGVLHPPGFPLQSWLNRLFIHLPILNPVTRLSLLSLLAHATATFLIVEGLRVSQVHIAASVFGGLAYSLFPSTWYSGVQPEVFAISHLCLAAAVTQSLYFASLPSHSLKWKEGISISLLGALSLSQSPITITAAPAFLFSAGLVLKQNTKNRFRLLLICVFAFFACLALMYISLPLLRTQSPWPDWGKLNSISAIFDHFLRKDFGTFSLLPARSLGGKIHLTGLDLFFQETQRNWQLFALIGVLGLASVFQFPNRRVPIALVFSCFLAASLFLNIAFTESEDVFYKTVLERFIGTAVIPASYLMGFGLDYLIQKTKLRYRRTVILFALLIFPSITLIPSYKIANASKDCTIDVLRDAISLEVPSDALYISSQSEEYFYGILQNKKLRFPLMRGQFFEYPWYRNEVLSQIEPRLAGADIRNVFDLKEYAQTHDIRTIVSLDDSIFKQFGGSPELRGVLYFSDRSTTQPFSEQTVRSVVKLCPLMNRLEELPVDHHGYSHQLRKFFARGFNGAAIYLDLVGNREAALAASRIFEGLMTSQDSSTWKKGCSDLISKLQK